MNILVYKLCLSRQGLAYKSDSLLNNLNMILE